MTDTATEQDRELLRAELAERTMYELLGGADGVRSIVDHFYDLMDQPRFEPIRAMHAPDLTPMRVALFEFLSGWLGGPPLYLQRSGSPCLTAAHAPFPIDITARDLWLECMVAAMHAAGVADRYRTALMPALSGMADMMRAV
jgi:hemoglobin